MQKVISLLSLCTALILGACGGGAQQSQVGIELVKGSVCLHALVVLAHAAVANE